MRKKKEEILLPDIYEQLYLFRIKAIYLAKLCAGFEKAEGVIKASLVEEIGNCSLFWKTYLEVIYKAGKTGWIPYVNSKLLNCQTSAKDAFYFVEGGIAIDSTYSVKRGEKENLPATKASFSYSLKPWCGGEKAGKFKAGAPLARVLQKVEKKFFDYESKKGAVNSCFEVSNDMLGFFSYLYAVDFDKKICESLSVFKAFAKIKKAVKTCEKKELNKDTFLEKELAKTIFKLKAKMEGARGGFPDKRNVLEELEEINALILASKGTGEGLALLGAMFKIDKTVFNLQIFDKEEKEGRREEGLEQERTIFDYYASQRRWHKAKNLALYEKLKALNQETENFTRFLLGALEKYKTSIMLALM